jgi:hypothetical protein
MADGYTVKVEELRTHATHLDALRERFAAVKAASAHIARDDQAYGTLCGWIGGLLESKHGRQDELIAFVEENLAIAARGLRDNATSYEARESGAQKSIQKIDSDMSGAR